VPEGRGELEFPEPRQPHEGEAAGLPYAWQERRRTAAATCQRWEYLEETSTWWEGAGENTGAQTAEARTRHIMKQSVMEGPCQLQYNEGLRRERLPWASLGRVGAVPCAVP